MTPATADGIRRVSSATVPQWSRQPCSGDMLSKDGYRTRRPGATGGWGSQASAASPRRHNAVYLGQADSWLSTSHEPTPTAGVSWVGKRPHPWLVRFGWSEPRRIDDESRRRAEGLRVRMGFGVRFSRGGAPRVVKAVTSYHCAAPLPRPWRWARSCGFSPRPFRTGPAEGR